MLEVWEGVARAFHEATGMDVAPVSAFELAYCAGLRTIPAEVRGAFLDKKAITYDVTARRVRQHGLVAHELGHWALRWAKEDDSEQGADCVAGALMLPRQVFSDDVKRFDWNFAELRRRHRNASAQMIGYRIAQVRTAVCSVFDEARLRARFVSPWVQNQGVRRVSDLEQEMAAEALVSGELAVHSSTAYAVPVFDPPWRRVVVVCDADAIVPESTMKGWG